MCVWLGIYQVECAKGHSLITKATREDIFRIRNQDSKSVCSVFAFSLLLSLNPLPWLK